MIFFFSLTKFAKQYGTVDECNHVVIRYPQCIGRLAVKVHVLLTKYGFGYRSCVVVRSSSTHIQLWWRGARFRECLLFLLAARYQQGIIKQYIYAKGGICFFFPPYSTYLVLGFVQNCIFYVALRY